MKMRHGQSIVELLVGLSLAAILLPALLTGFIASREGKSRLVQRSEAIGLAREAEEALRSVREADWNNIAVNGTYHPVQSGSAWSLSAGSETVNGYARSIVLSDVRRDASGAIVASGGTIDPSTKKARVSVSWGIFLPMSVTAELYLTHKSQAVWVQTTKADFDAGTKTSVITTDTAGGEVTLAAGGAADWCFPNLSITAIDLPKQGVANAISAIQGNVFAATGDNASGVSYANVPISDTNPPVGTVSGTFSFYKTNGIYGVPGYVLLATDTNSKEIIILNVNTNPISEVGLFDAPGPTDGNSVFASGNVGYATVGSTLYTFDLSSYTGSRTQLGSVALAGTGNRVVVVGSYAYVAVDSTSSQLQIIDVSNPSNPTVVGQAQLPGAGGQDVYVNSAGTRAYVATHLSATQREFFIVDTTVKTGNHTVIGSYDSNGMDPQGVTVVTANKAILVGIGGQEYQVINIASETSPVQCGGLNIDTGVHGVASVQEADGDAYSYIITGDASSELKIIEGGPGGKFAKNGTFESSTFDAGKTVAFNRYVADAVVPTGSTIEYQVASANAVGGSCSGVTFTFVGPDGTTNTRFTANADLIPFATNATYVNPGRCFRYKAFLSTTDLLYTPILNDLTVNYSP